MTACPANQALTLAQARLIRAVGGQDAATGFCRINRHQTLSDYGNPDHGAQMPVDVVRDLEAVTRGLPGAPHVTRELARQAGFALFSLPAAKPEGVAWPQHLACIAKETGEMVASLAKALADGKVDQAERQALLKHADKAIDSVIALRAALAAAAEDTS